MGDEPKIIEQFFNGFEGVIMGWIMGSQKIMGSDYGSNINDVTELFCCMKCIIKRMLIILKKRRVINDKDGFWAAQ